MCEHCIFYEGENRSSSRVALDVGCNSPLTSGSQGRDLNLVIRTDCMRLVKYAEVK